VIIETKKSWGFGFEHDRGPEKTGEGIKCVFLEHLREISG